MKGSKWVKLAILSAFGLAMGVAAVQLVASVGDPVDPPKLGSGPGGGNGPGGGSGGNGQVPIKDIRERFADSLHATRMGKPRFYNAYWDLNDDGIVDEEPGGVDDNGGFEHSVADIHGAENARYDDLPCKNCHYAPAVASPVTDTDDELFPGDCSDCHWNVGAKDYGVPANEVAYCDVEDPDKVVIGVCPEDYDPATRFGQDDVCIACHGRQKAEHTFFPYDVHRAIDAENPEEDPQFGCMGCHQETEVHGDGTAPDSHLDNPKTSCAQSGCHEQELNPGRGKKGADDMCEDDDSDSDDDCQEFHQQHLADIDCTACHVKSNTTCNSCHFDSEMDHKKRFYRQIPAHGFKFLMNFKDIQNPEVTKVRTATYQSLTVGAVCVDGICNFDPENTDEVQTFVVFAPYAAHSVTKAEDLECLDCHVKKDGDGGYEGNPAVVQYLTEGTVTTTTWNPDPDPDEVGEPGLLEGPTGIIPLPHDWISETGGKGVLDMDFAYYLGNTTDDVTKDLDGGDWAFLKTGPDRGHTPYGTPLSKGQMRRLILKKKKHEGKDDDDDSDDGNNRPNR